MDAGHEDARLVLASVIHSRTDGGVQQGMLTSADVPTTSKERREAVVHTTAGMAVVGIGSLRWLWLRSQPAKAVRAKGQFRPL